MTPDAERHAEASTAPPAEAPGKEANTRLARAISMQQAGKITKAEALYEEILQDNPTHVDALYLLGWLKITKQAYLSAIGFLNRAIAVNPLNYHYHGLLAMACLNSDRFDEAEAAYQKAFSLNPTYTAALIGLGDIYKKRNAPQKAIRCFQQAIFIDPKSTTACNNLGTTFQSQGNLVKAEACFRNVLKINPGDKIGLTNLGNTFQRMGKNEDAIRQYKKALAIDRDFTPAYLNMGFAYETLKNVDAAIEAFKNVVDRQPDNGIALAYLYHQYQYACDWRALKRLANAIDSMTQRAVEADRVPEEPPFLNILRHMDPKLNHAVARLWSLRIMKHCGAPDDNKLKQ